MMTEQLSTKIMNKIILGDCLVEMAKLPQKSVDMIFADPPYNLQLPEQRLQRPDHTPVEPVWDAWDKFDNFSAYDALTKQWLIQARRVLKDDGCLWVIGSYHNIFRVGRLIQDCGFWVLNDIIWRKSNPMPNFKGRRFTNAHETLIWAAKSEKSRYTFNYQAMKALNEDTQMRSDWYFASCVGLERLKDEQGKRAHPTQKPQNLLARVILASTHKGDVILDPFFGSGTTGAVAKQLKRNFVGIEKQRKYVQLAKKRIEAVMPMDETLLDAHENQGHVKVPFGTLVETGYIEAGTTLLDKAGGRHALVRPDGRLMSHEHGIGSIHTLAALMQNLPACNGWLFWYITNQGQMMSINELREAYRHDHGLG